MLSEHDCTQSFDYKEKNYIYYFLDIDVPNEFVELIKDFCSSTYLKFQP